MNWFSKTLREKRESKGLSQEDLAEKLGVKSGKQTISRWELGKSEPSMSDLKKIAEILETSVASLIDETVEARLAEAEPKPGYISVPMEEYIDLQRIAIKNLKDDQNKGS